MDFSPDGREKEKVTSDRSEDPFSKADRPVSFAKSGVGWAISLKLEKLPEIAAKVNSTRNLKNHFFFSKMVQLLWKTV